MTVSGDREDEPRREQLEALVRLDDKVSEAAEAAAKAAAHAVEATKAAEAAAAARLARKDKEEQAAKAGRAVQKAKVAKDKASEAAQAAKAAKQASDETAQHVPVPDEPTVAPGSEARVLEVSLTDDEIQRLDQMAAEQDVPAPQVARALLRQALDHPED